MNQSRTLNASPVKFPHPATDYCFYWKVESSCEIDHACYLRNIVNLKEFVEQVAKFTGKPEFKYSINAIFVESDKRPILTITQLETLLSENRLENEFLTAKGMKNKTLTFTAQPFDEKVHEKIECLWLSHKSKLRDW